MRLPELLDYETPVGPPPSGSTDNVFVCLAVAAAVAGILFAGWAWWQVFTL
jgi:hypothetical protein